MWIFLGILFFIAALITAILLLPIYVIIKTDENGELIFRYKILHKTFGENPNPNDPIIKMLKNASGISRLEKGSIKANAKQTSVLSTLKSSFSLIIDLLKELLGLLKYCKAKTFKLNIVCADTDAAEAAISYGQCCAFVVPALAYIDSLIDIKPSGKDINISCDYSSAKGSVFFDTVLVVRLHRVLAALLRAIIAEAKRIADEQRHTSNHYKN